jgi:hypothetical protein
LYQVASLDLSDLNLPWAPLGGRAAKELWAKLAPLKQSAARSAAASTSTGHIRWHRSAMSFAILVAEHDVAPEFAARRRFK